MPERIHEKDGSVLIHVPGGAYTLGEELPLEHFAAALARGTVEEESARAWNPAAVIQ